MCILNLTELQQSKPHGDRKGASAKKKSFSTICARVLHVLREHMGEQGTKKRQGRAREERKRKKEAGRSKEKGTKQDGIGKKKKKKEKRQGRKKALQGKDRT